MFSKRSEHFVSKSVDEQQMFRQKKGYQETYPLKSSQITAFVAYKKHWSAPCGRKITLALGVLLLELDPNKAAMNVMAFGNAS